MAVVVADAVAEVVWAWAGVARSAGTAKPPYHSTAANKKNRADSAERRLARFPVDCMSIL